MKNAKRLVACALATMMILPTSGCSKKEDSKETNTSKVEETSKDSSEDESNKGETKKLKNPNVSIAMWFPLADYDEKMFKDFEEKYGAKVNIINVPRGDAYYTKLVTGVASGDPTDLTYFQGDFYPGRIIKGLVQPIDDFVKDDPFWDKQKMEAYRWNGKHYALCSPLYHNIVLTYYNKKLFEKEGLKTPLEYEKEGQWNWDNYLKSAKALTKDTDGDGKVDQWGGYVWPPYAVNSNDTTFVRYPEGGKPELNIDDPKLSKSLQWLQDLHVKHQVSGGDFYKGTCGMLTEGHWLAKELKDLDWDVVGMPSGPDNKDKHSIIEYKAWGIPVGAKNPEGAIELAKYITAPETGTLLSFRGFTDEQLERVKGYFKDAQGNRDGILMSNGAEINFGDILKGKSVATSLAEQKPKFQTAIDKATEEGEIIKEGKPFAGMKKIDFEDGKTEPIKKLETGKGISVTDKKEEVLDGKYSLKVESEVQDKVVKIFEMDPSYVNLEPGHSYKVSFDYKIITDGAKGGKYHISFVDKDEKTIGGADIEAKKGEKVSYSSDLHVYEKFKDLHLVFESSNAGDIIIDNINIEATN